MRGKKMKTITKKITLNIEESRDKKTLIVKDGPTLGLIMGTCAAQGSPHCYGIVREGAGRRWLVPKAVIKARVDRMEQQVKDWINRIEVMKEVLK
jgi:hypothetical protein